MPEPRTVTIEVTPDELACLESARRHAEEWAARSHGGAGAEFQGRAKALAGLIQKLKGAPDAE